LSNETTSTFWTGNPLPVRVQNLESIVEATETALAGANDAVALANQKAADAATSATNALTSAQNASLVVADVETHANNAATSEANAKTYRDQAQAAQAAADASNVSATAAVTTVLNAGDAAAASVSACQTAQSAAETARTGAETAKTGAETARTGAETARDTTIAALGNLTATQVKVTDSGTITGANIQEALSDLDTRINTKVSNTNPYVTSESRTTSYHVRQWSNGLIEMTGTSVLTTNGGGVGTVTLPIAFPTAQIAPMVVNGDHTTSATNYPFTIISPGSTGGNWPLNVLQFLVPSNPNTTVRVNWRTEGY
jgi:hypothetical protein